jgi:BarA-like signal transduction histidine kinase
MKVVEKIKTLVLWSITFPENCAVYEIMLKNVVEQERPQMTIQHGACALHAG